MSPDSALARAQSLIRPASLATAASTEGGYLDLLGPEPAPQPTLAQRAMNSRLLAAAYERAWRPAWGAAIRAAVGDEHAKAAADLRLDTAHTLLDVACGPGNFTRHLGDRLADDGLAIGFDISRAMLEQAVRDNRGPRTAYVRGDARELPFDDATFDAVCCYAALYLMPEPMRIVTELIRVLAPGGRVAIMTSARPHRPLAGSVVTSVAGMLGVRVFTTDTFTRAFTAAGLTELSQQVSSIVQFVSATKPVQSSHAEIVVEDTRQ